MPSPPAWSSRLQCLELHTGVAGLLQGQPSRHRTRPFVPDDGGVYTATSVANIGAAVLVLSIILACLEALYASQTVAEILSYLNQSLPLSQLLSGYLAAATP